MTKITETELKNKVASLREKISEVWYNPATWGQAGGGNTAGGAATGNPNLAKQGKKAGATQQSAKPAPVAPAGAPKVAYDKGYPEATVKELQTKLNAAGEKLTVDGKMGPATRDAQARHPEITTQPAAAQAVAADINSANQAAPAAPAMTAADQEDADMGAAMTANAAVAPTAAPTASAGTPPPPAAAPTAAPAAAPTAAPAPAGMQAQGDDEGNTTITRPDGSTMVVGADGKQIMPGSNPNLPQNKGVLNTVKNAVKGTGDFQKPTGFIPPAPAAAPAPTQESVGFRNDELSRIVSLVHHR